MSRFQWIVVLLAVAALALGAWMFRYEPTAKVPFLYDRWTGRIVLGPIDR